MKNGRKVRIRKRTKKEKAKSGKEEVYRERMN